jgi:Pyruvate/2-oxoacid:ferredoxin oxidoreductase gamma subunit
MAKDSIKVRLPGLGGQGAVTAAHIAATAADTGVLRKNRYSAYLR